MRASTGKLDRRRAVCGPEHTAILVWMCWANRYIRVARRYARLSRALQIWQMLKRNFINLLLKQRYYDGRRHDRLCCNVKHFARFKVIKVPAADVTLDISFGENVA